MASTCVSGFQRKLGFELLFVLIVQEVKRPETLDGAGESNARTTAAQRKPTCLARPLYWARVNVEPVARSHEQLPISRGVHDLLYGLIMEL